MSVFSLLLLLIQVRKIFPNSIQLGIADYDQSFLSHEIHEYAESEKEKKGENK
jgi:hypothetical protein